jgi:hypothetical protein
MKFILLVSFLAMTGFAQEQDNQTAAPVKRVVKKKKKKRKYRMMLEFTSHIETTLAQNKTVGVNSKIDGIPGLGLKFIAIKPDKDQFSWYGHVAIRSGHFDYPDVPKDKRQEEFALQSAVGAMYKSNVGLLSSIRFELDQHFIAKPGVNDSLNITQDTQTVIVPKISVSIYRNSSRYSGVEAGFRTMFNGANEGGLVVNGGKGFFFGMHRWLNKKRSKYWKLTFMNDELDMGAYTYITRGLYWNYGWRI